MSIIYTVESFRTIYRRHLHINFCGKDNKLQRARRAAIDAFGELIM